MKGENWTKGNWQVEGRTVFCLNKERMPVNRFSATVDPGFDDDGKRVFGEEQDANARLMKSAPKLYEALKLVKQTIWDESAERGDSDMLDVILDAMQEARGEP